MLFYRRHHQAGVVGHVLKAHGMSDDDVRAIYGLLAGLSAIVGLANISKLGAEATLDAIHSRIRK